MLALGIKSLSTARVSAMRALNLHTSLASRYFSSETGSVKFYIRRKAFGFITRDSTGDDIFVHRTEISGATSDDPFNPELRTGERVKFEVKEMNGKTFATQVTMEDGSMVPKMRDDFSSKRVRSIKSRLGFQVYDILTEGGDENTIASKISEAYSKACEDIEAAERMPTFDDFSPRS